MTIQLTPNLGLRYPEPDERLNQAPVHIQTLAEDLDAALLTLAVMPTPDGGFPTSAAAITAETVIDRFTIAAAPYARRLTVVCNAYVTVSVAPTQVNLVLYANGVAIGYGRRNIPGAALPDEVVASGRFDLPANTALVLEARVARQAGTGTVSTSASSNLTNTNVLLVRR